MATPSPLTLLVIFLALAAAPSSATHLRIYLPSLGDLTLTREPGDWWLRQDETSGTVAVKREGTSLVQRTRPDQAETRTDLAAHFDLTGCEDFTNDTTIRPKGPQWTGAITTHVEPNYLVVHVPAAGPQAAIVTWSTP